MIKSTVAFAATPEMNELAIKEGLVYGVPGAIHQNDHIFGYFNRSSPSLEYSVKGYIGGGSSDARQIGSLVDRLGLTSGVEALEFAAGYGRVTRHLRAGAPQLLVTACDIHEEACEFIKNELGIPAIQSDSDPKSFKVERSFDLIFALSFFSHIPERTFGLWIDALCRHLKIGGYLVFTTHGEFAAKKHETLERAVDRKKGYGFLAQSEQEDLSTAEYGTTIVYPNFVINQSDMHGLQLQQFDSGSWFGLQDEWVFKKV